jgi:hypothetical protein
MLSVISQLPSKSHVLQPCGSLTHGRLGSAVGIGVNVVTGDDIPLDSSDDDDADDDDDDDEDDPVDPSLDTDDAPLDSSDDDDDDVDALDSSVDFDEDPVDSSDDADDDDSLELSISHMGISQYCQSRSVSLSGR